MWKVLFLVLHIEWKLFLVGSCVEGFHMNFIFLIGILCNSFKIQICP